MGVHDAMGANLLDKKGGKYQNAPKNDLKFVCKIHETRQSSNISFSIIDNMSEDHFVSS